MDRGTYLVNAGDTIRRLREHPSLCSYAGGGNELLGDGSSASPPEDIDRGLRKLGAELDGRLYVSSSVTDVGDAFDGSRALAPKDGPYGIRPEEAFFDRNAGFPSPLSGGDGIERGTTASDPRVENPPGGDIGFQTEVGSVSHPELESLGRFLSRDALDSYPDCGETSEHGGSVHHEWA